MVGLSIPDVLGHFATDDRRGLGIGLGAGSRDQNCLSLHFGQNCKLLESLARTGDG